MAKVEHLVRRVNELLRLQQETEGKGTLQPNAALSASSQARPDTAQLKGRTSTSGYVGVRHFPGLSETEVDQPIYRTLPFTRLAEMLRERSYFLVRTDLWDDPVENYCASAIYEGGGKSFTFTRHQQAFGSCWSQVKESDALWRIYSPDKQAVRISTTPRKLAAAFGAAKQPIETSRMFIGKVTYVSEAEFGEVARDLALARADPTKSAKSQSLVYLLKRDAFAHEREIRLMYVGERRRQKRRLVHCLSCDPASFIDTVVLDPRVPLEVERMYSEHLIAALGFKGSITKSSLYAPVQRLVVRLSASGGVRSRSAAKG